MDEIWGAVKGVIGAVAPTIATALGGPLAGAAVGAVASALGLPADAPQDQVAAAVAKADPAALLALKQAEQQFLADMKRLDVDVARLANEDRADARSREVQLGDRTPMILALVVTLGFFGVLGWMLASGIPEHGGEALLVMLGALGTAWGAVVNYYFGSSAGSKDKSDAMAAALRGR